MAGRNHFIRNGDAGVAVEFVALLPAFLFITFFIFEITVALLWIGTAEKAVQIGARLAIVTDPVAVGVPSVNQRTTNGVFGKSCSDVSGPCEGFDPVSCSGDSDSCTDNFDIIVNRMSSVFALLGNLPQPAKNYVTMTYTDVKLGYAGGPVVPSVTVTLSGVPYGAVMTTILGNIFDGSSPLVTLPTISVTLTGEDLSTAGA